MADPIRPASSPCSRQAATKQQPRRVGTQRCDHHRHFSRHNLTSFRGLFVWPRNWVVRFADQPHYRQAPSSRRRRGDLIALSGDCGDRFPHSVSA